MQKYDHVKLASPVYENCSAERRVMALDPSHGCQPFRARTQYQGFLAQTLLGMPESRTNVSSDVDCAIQASRRRFTHKATHIFRSLKFARSAGRDVVQIQARRSWQFAENSKKRKAGSTGVILVIIVTIIVCRRDFHQHSALPNPRSALLSFI